MGRRRPAQPPRSLRSLRVTDAFRSFVLDQLADLGEVVPRSMFGGVGLYCDGLFFGIIARDVLYLKVDDRTRADYEALAAPTFQPYFDRPGTMQYYAVPLAVLESAMELVSWARKAVAVAERAAASTNPKRRVTSSRPAGSSRTRK